MNYYYRKLPHWQPQGAEYFVTVRLANSLPGVAIERIRYERDLINNQIKSQEMQGISGSDKLSDLQTMKQRRIFEKFKALLDGAESGPTWLLEPEVAKLVCEAIHYRDHEEYDLYAYCVMPNHIHMVFKLIKHSDNTESTFAVTDILKSLKWYAALRANQILNRSGSFWQAESYDTVIRNYTELERTISYVLNNPVKARLVPSWRLWPYSYCKPEFRSTFM